MSFRIGKSAAMEYIKCEAKVKWRRTGFGEKQKTKKGYLSCNKL